MHNMGLARLYQRLEGSRVGADTVDLDFLIPTSLLLAVLYLILSAILAVDLRFSPCASYPPAPNPSYTYATSIS